MNFKSQVENDLKKVFHDSNVFAENIEFWCNGNRYYVPVTLDYTGSSDRKKSSSDHIEGLNQIDLTMYIPLSVMRKIPKRGQQVEIGDEIYTILKVENEMGELVLKLGMIDE